MRIGVYPWPGQSCTIELCCANTADDDQNGFDCNYFHQCPRRGLNEEEVEAGTIVNCKQHLDRHVDTIG